MNKWLIRQVRPLTKRLTPQWAASLVRMIDSRTRGVKTKQEALSNIAKLLEETIAGLKRRGMATDAIVRRIDIIATLAALWIDLTFALLLASFSPAILLLLCLKATLGSKSKPEPLYFLLGPPKGFVPLPDAEIGGCARNDSLIAPLVN